MQYNVDPVEIDCLSTNIVNQKFHQSFAKKNSLDLAVNNYCQLQNYKTIVIHLT